MFLHVNTIKYYTSTTTFSPSFANLWSITPVYYENYCQREQYGVTYLCVCVCVYVRASQAEN